MSWNNDFFDDKNQFYIKDLDLTFLSICRSNDAFNGYDVKLFKDLNGNHVMYQKFADSENYYIKSKYQLSAFDPEGQGLRCFNNNQTY